VPEFVIRDGFRMVQPRSFFSILRDVIRGMRVHQWLKNLLLFVPAATSHRILDPTVFEPVLLAFFGFSACSSA
jgi:4-hydroxybenzoate polyprenyltransferase